MISTPLRTLRVARFSTSSQIAQKTFARFQEKYQLNAEAFKKKMNSTSQSGAQIKKSNQRAYVHPFNDAHRPIINGAMKSLQAQRDLFGPEQVSPHYEHFSMSRRHALIFFGGVVGLRLVSSFEDISLFAQNALYAWIFLYSYLYFFIEGKKSFMMPLLNRFYKRIIAMETTNVQRFYNENAEARTRNLMAIAKSQIQYKLVHNQYLSIRNNTLLNFLISQQVALKNHIWERAENILRQAQAIQQVNQQRIINDVMSQTLKSIDLAYSQHKEEIQSKMFTLALQGIANGKMNYSNDPILPYVVQTINQTVEKFSKISPQQQTKMVSVNANQIEEIRAADARARDEFLKSQPKIDGTLRNNEIVSRILSAWGR